MHNPPTTILAAATVIAAAYAPAGTAYDVSTPSPFCESSTASMRVGPADSLYHIFTYTTRDTIHIVEHALTLREIIRRAVRGEQTKLAGHHDMTYTMSIRTIVSWRNKRKIEDELYRGYSDADGVRRTVRLDQRTVKEVRRGDAWSPAPHQDSSDRSPIRVSTGGIDTFAEIPFFLEYDYEYDFQLLDRTLEDDHVIFKIGFRPKSRFKPLPSGTVYVDTDHYRIVHEQFDFERNPYPLFLKGVRRVSRHWTRLPGGEWVFDRILFEADLRTDPFGWVPGNVAGALEVSDVSFDRGYDSDQFGDFSDRPDPVASDSVPDRTVAAASRPRSTGEWEADSSGVLDELARDASSNKLGGGFLGHLRGADLAEYRHELFAADAAVRDSMVALFDSLGIEGLHDVQGTRERRIRFAFGLAESLTAYNRTEGLVGGAAARLYDGSDGGATLRFEGAWASRTRRFRHVATLSVPMRRGPWELTARAYRADRTMPFGSNRPALNGVRALVGGADDQDYLRREGGGGGVTLSHDAGASISLGYDAVRETRIDARKTFSVFGNIDDANAPIVAGNSRSASLRLGWPSLAARRLSLAMDQRLAGGLLGGDFNFARTSLAAAASAYLIGRQELIVHAAFVATAGRPPAQYLADVGGLSTVRGYPRRRRVGEASLALRLEYPIPYDLLGAVHVAAPLGVQFVPWFDAGRVWRGNGDDWLRSAGLGVQCFLGAFGRASNLRLDVSFPVGHDRPDDVHIDLRFAPGAF